MSEAIDPKLKNALKILIKKSEVSFTAEAVLNEFSKPKEKNTIKKLFGVIKNLVKNNPAAKRPFEELTNNFDKHDPFQCLLIFLKSYADIISNNETPITSPSLCSTKIGDQTTPHSISDIKKRIVQAASEGLSKSAQISSVLTAPSNNAQISPLILKRPHSFWYFNNFNADEFCLFQQMKILAIPITNQEQVIITEVIYACIGLPGTYITPETPTRNGIQPIKFKVSDQVQISLRDIVLEILPLASHYSMVQKFIQQQTSDLKCGQVLQALGASLRLMMQDYNFSICQLETERMNNILSLHKLLYSLRPIMNIMEVLAETVVDINKSEITGGKVLSLLFDKITYLTGDADAQRIIIHLTEMAAVPYIEMLDLWIHKGVIIDSQQEFLVEDNEVISREEIETNHYSDSYWEKRYTIRRDRIPRFLENFSDIILRTGKYLNVIRQCGNHVSPPKLDKFCFTPINNNHLLLIKSAYHYASRTLLELLIKKKDLMGHLLSVKRFFLLYQGDFIIQFMDASEEELTKNVDRIHPMKLENLLGLTLQASSAKHDPYKDDLHCELFTMDIVNQMSQIHLVGSKSEHYTNDIIDLTGIECFAFCYVVQWPLSLVLNHFALSEYQMLFRQLFYCKHVERQLCKVWIENKNTIKFSPKTAELYRFSFSLRQRMMCTIQNLEYYMMVEVIEPMWHDFIVKMKNVENVDDVLSVHQDFLDTCMQNCLLKNPDLLHTIIKMCNVCLNFCKLAQNQYEPIPTDDYLARVKCIDIEFTKLLISLLKEINRLSYENPSGKLSNLVHRINFNSFYSVQLEAAENSTEESE